MIFMFGRGILLPVDTLLSPGILHYCVASLAFRLIRSCSKYIYHFWLSPNQEDGQPAPAKEFWEGITHTFVALYSKYMNDSGSITLQRRFKAEAEAEAASPQYRCSSL